MLKTITEMKEVTHIECTTRNRSVGLEITINTYLRFDKTLLNSSMIRSLKHLHALLTGIHLENFKVPIAGKIFVSAHDYNNQASTQNVDYNTQGTLKNPHLSDFNCFGTNKHLVDESLLHANWTMVVRYVEQAIAEINLADSVVMRRFNDKIQQKDFNIEIGDEKITYLKYRQKELSNENTTD